MVEYVKISPLTRLEGHLGITARINSDAVSAAYAHGEMFRGFEKILIDRDPRDAPVITSRTCGVCHFVHRHTSLRAIENAAGFSFPAPQAADGGTPGDGSNVRWIDGDRTMNYTLGAGGTNPLPLGAQLARNIVHGLTYVYSHAAHTIALAAPDYKARIDEYVVTYTTDLAAYGFISTAEGDGTDSFFDNFYNEAVVAQRILHEMLGFLGGKVPHQQSAIPGGFSRSFTGPLFTGGTDMDAIAALAGKTIGHGGADPSTATDSWPLLDLSGGLDAGNTLIGTVDWIQQRVSVFTLALAVGAHQEGATLWGRGSDNFVAAPTFDIVTTSSITGEAYFRGGAEIADGLAANGAGTYKLDNTVADAADSTWVTVYEDITSGKYPEPDDISGRPVCGGYPGDTETHPLVGEAGDKYAYTWYKATRVKDSDDKLFAVESGPFARLVVNDLDPTLNLGGQTVPPLGTLNGDGLRNDVYTAAGYAGSTYAWLSTTWNRLIGRLQDTLLCIDMIIGSNYSGENTGTGWLQEISGGGSWLTRLDAAISALGSPIPASRLVQDTPPNGAWENLTGKTGAGYWDAPRGITCHFCKVDGGTLSQYQHIAGTTWNGNGRDAQGNPGPFEWSLMGMTKDETDVAFTEGSGGKWTASITAPVCERTVFIKYELQEGTSSSYKEYTAKDVPKHDGSEEGQIVGQGLKETSKINYTSGDITLEFKFVSSSPDYDYMRNVRVDQYGTATDPVPTPVTWNDYKGHSDDTTKPNPINILRTIRSYDPCLACSIHVTDKKGTVGKYEAVPMAGWDPK